MQEFFKSSSLLLTIKKRCYDHFCTQEERYFQQRNLLPYLSNSLEVIDSQINHPDGVAGACIQLLKKIDQMEFDENELSLGIKSSEESDLEQHVLLEVAQSIEDVLTQIPLRERLFFLKVYLFNLARWRKSLLAAA